MQALMAPPAGLKHGVDWREPKRRQEAFQRFYSFHLRYRAHPGCVYYLMPWLRRDQEWSQEDALWFAFLNGNTQHPPTSLLLFNAWRTGGVEGMLEFYRQEYDRLAFDTDRRHHKPFLAESTEGYLKQLAGRSQEDYWQEQAAMGWDGVWKAATGIPTFGRLSAFSYAEYLRIMGVPFDCEDLLLGDRQGSRSHRNGLCIVLGWEHMDWHDSNPGFNGKYPKPVVEQLRGDASTILAEARRRSLRESNWRDAPLGDYGRDVSYFTLESALCTYKSWHRPKRRYPNVYNDMLHDRLKLTEQRWGEAATEPFWRARRECLPAHLRLEDNPTDPGCIPLKQNWYLETGQAIMMSREFPDMANDLEDGIAAGRWGTFR